MFKISTQKKFRGALSAILGLAVLASAGGAALAEEQTGGLPGEWLSSYLGARAGGIGGAFTAVVDGPTGVVWNPAGLSFLSQNEVYTETALLFESTSISGIGLAVPARRLPSFGLTILSLRSGDFERTNGLNESLGEFSEGDLAFFLSAAKNVTSKLSLGANVKIIRQAVEDFNATGVGVDLGALYDITPWLRVGASVANIGGPTLALRSFEEKYPVEARSGLAARFLSGRGLVSGELSYRDGPGVTLRAGSEFWVHSSMAMRFGYVDAVAGGFSFRVTPELRFDYSASDHDLGVTHRIGLSYQFGGFFASSEANPPVFSPIGERSVTKFNLQARTKADVTTWRLEIFDKSNNVVRSFGGSGVPPAHLMWDGKDATGLPLPDGEYRYTFIVVDAEGREIQSSVKKVEITTEGPKGSVPVFTSR